MLDELTGGSALLGLLFRNQELVTHVKTDGNLGCSDLETVD